MKGGVLSLVQRKSMFEFFNIKKQNQGTPNKNYEEFVKEMIEYYKNEEGTNHAYIFSTLNPLLNTNQGKIDGKEYFNLLMSTN